MNIYLVQSGESLDGNDGYSYGLLHGEHNRLLVSFVDFASRQKPAIFPKPPHLMNRRHLTKRAREAK